MNMQFNAIKFLFVRYIAFVMLCLFSSSAHAFFFKSLCNIGVDSITEYWDDKIKRTIDKPGSNCPPWGRGRPQNSCITQYDYPSYFTGYYLRSCAEASEENRYFNPTIKIRYQACNALACWNKSKNLTGHGSCVVWPGAYGLPTLRICARVAYPEKLPTDSDPNAIAADHGYTNGVHLGSQGQILDDEVFYDDYDNIINQDRPKLCAYKDPGLLDIIQGDVDLMDYKPTYQPLHHTEELNMIGAIITVILNIIEKAAGAALRSTINGTIKSISMGRDTLDVKIIRATLTFIGDVILYIGEDIIMPILRAFVGRVFQLNAVVDDPLGCVEIPLGPYPPQFCPYRANSGDLAETNLVCESGALADGTSTLIPVISESAHLCVNSMLDNNFVNNVVRVTFDDFVPICEDDTTDVSKTDSCVRFKNLPAGITTSSAKIIYAATNYLGIVRACSAVQNTNELCVDTSIPEPRCDNGGSNSIWCSDGFRIAFGVAAQGDNTITSTPTNYFSNDLVDCSDISSQGMSCQKVWGVNVGNFKDVALRFPLQEVGYNILSLNSIRFGLTDRDNNSYSYFAKIPRVEETMQDDAGNTVNINPKNICVFSTNNRLVGCESREGVLPLLKGKASSSSPIGSFYCRNIDGAEIPCNGLSYKPSIFQCGSAGANFYLDGSSCNEDYFNPKAVAVLGYGAYTTAGVVSLDPNPDDSTLNLAGVNLKAFATDDNYIQMPFSGPNAIDVLNIYGKYVTSTSDAIISPYLSDNKTINNSAIYIKGLEYKDGNYVRGATNICLNYEIEKCSPAATQNCVLSKLKNTDVINCSYFASLKSKYYGFDLCDSSYTGCSTSAKETITGNNNSLLQVFECNNATCIGNDCPKYSYCYQYSSTTTRGALCYSSNAAADRFIPSSTLGINLQDQYYDLTINNNMHYNNNLYELRTKTPVELGLCAPVTQPSCKAITDLNNANGYALWPETKIGSKAASYCPSRYAPTGNVQRYCTIDQSNNVNFAPINLTEPICKALLDVTVDNSKSDKAFPSSYTLTQNTDQNNMTSIRFGSLTRNSLRDDSDSLLGQYFQSDITFDIPDVGIFEYFDIVELVFDDYLYITTSIGDVYFESSNTSAPFKIDSKSINQELRSVFTAGSSIRYVWYVDRFFFPYVFREQDRVRYDYNRISLLPFLRNGKNTISFRLLVYGGGTLMYKIKYRYK